MVHDGSMVDIVFFHEKAAFLEQLGGIHQYMDVLNSGMENKGVVVGQDPTQAEAYDCSGQNYTRIMESCCRNPGTQQGVLIDCEYPRLHNYVQVIANIYHFLGSLLLLNPSVSHQS